MSDYASIMADGVPRIVTSRWASEDAHTLAGYESSGSYRGYAGIRTALELFWVEAGRASRPARCGGSFLPTCSLVTSW